MKSRPSLSFGDIAEIGELASSEGVGRCDVHLYSPSHRLLYLVQSQTDVALIALVSLIGADVEGVLTSAPDPDNCCGIVLGHSCLLVKLYWLDLFSLVGATHARDIVGTQPDDVSSHYPRPPNASSIALILHLH